MIVRWICVFVFTSKYYQGAKLQAFLFFATKSEKVPVKQKNAGLKNIYDRIYTIHVIVEGGWVFIAADDLNRGHKYNEYNSLS